MCTQENSKVKVVNFKEILKRIGAESVTPGNDIALSASSGRLPRR